MVKNKLKIASIDLAYIAGFFDGEGCISGTLKRNRNPRVRITVTQKNPGILFWIKKTLDMGNVHVYLNNSSRWIVNNKGDVREFINLMFPYSKGKKEELMIGEKLNDLTNEGGDTHTISRSNRQERVILYDQLKLLKKKGEYDNDKKE
jgi:intein-encoded DNA endonuclease-like protein